MDIKDEMKYVLIIKQFLLFIWEKRAEEKRAEEEEEVKENLTEEVKKKKIWKTFLESFRWKMIFYEFWNFIRLPSKHMTFEDKKDGFANNFFFSQQCVL